MYHTNDMHGYVTESEDVIGLGKIAALKASDDDAILVDAGDATQGLPIASLTKGADIIRLMNVAGYDVMAAGNHEFDFGIDILKQNVALASFPMLGANVLYNGSPLLEAQTVIQKDGHRIGFFGISTTQTATSTNPEGMQGLYLRMKSKRQKNKLHP
ncbi:metallophosphoesterase [Faecalicoccus pleomorphus]